MAKVELGQHYKDEPTGFQGCATARTEHLAGHSFVKLEALDNYGKPHEAWFAEPRLDAVTGPVDTVGFRGGSNDV